jgi:hypothetical protein
MIERSISISRLRLLFATLDEPTLVTSHGVVVGSFVPASDPAETWNASVVVQYRPDPPDIELAKAVTESALALAEVEALRERLLPSDKVRGRAVARDREYTRRRLHLATLKREQEAT